MSAYLRQLDAHRTKQDAFGKTAGLRQLSAIGLSIPETWVCTVTAHRLFQKAPQRALQNLRTALEEQIDTSSSYAVRSSAPDEDGGILSQAGKYQSILHVQGIDAIVDAVREVWCAYEATATCVSVKLAAPMEVIVQKMINPVASGVSFSRHPVTGADEVMIEAVPGTSVGLLQLGQTPQRWVARSEVMKSEWAQLPTASLQEVADTTRRIADALRYPADVEWAFDGHEIWWLQVRPITTLHGIAVYSNKISREYLPGLVKPLVWSINVPMINGAWVDLFSRLVGRLSIDPRTLAKQFHFRAYFSMSGMGELLERLGLPTDALEQSLGLVPSPRAPLGFRWKMLRYGIRLLRFLGTLGRFHGRLDSWEERTAQSICAAREHLRQCTDLASLLSWTDTFLPTMRTLAQQRILSLLLHLIVGRLGRRAASRRGMNDAGVLELPDPRLEALDPIQGLRPLACELHVLSPSLRQGMDSLPLEEFLSQEGVGRVKHELNRFLESFGHLSQSGNDFTARPWCEDVQGVLKLALAHDFEGEVPSKPSSKVPWKLRKWSRRVTMRRIDRERVGSIFSRGVGLLREWAFAVSCILQEGMELRDKEDVFYLSLDELRSYSAGNLDARTMEKLMHERIEAYAGAANLALPDIILGDESPVPDEEGTQLAELSGLATSRGVHHGKARVLRSLEEAERLQHGDVLVVPFSDVAWTPLFKRAGAVVSESGGILSHSSIIAREYAIPAVVSVEGACARLDGCEVRVDGLRGTIHVISEASNDPSGEFENTSPSVS